MNYSSVKEIAKKWNISERTVRNYCANHKIDGAYLSNKKWYIPEDSAKPLRMNQKQDNALLQILKYEKNKKLNSGIYHKTQILFAYNSNHIEGSKLSKEETQFIFETNTIGLTKDPISVDDIIETVNHFRLFDDIIENANKVLTEKYIKRLHSVLKSNTSDSRLEWFQVGDYKKYPNEVGNEETALPEEVADKMKQLLKKYHSKKNVTLEDIITFHVQFEKIHPFQDGNGRVGRILLFKECLKYNIIPFIITDDLKYDYYRGLKNYNQDKNYLIDTCLSAQDTYRSYLDYFRISYTLK